MPGKIVFAFAALGSLAAALPQFGGDYKKGDHSHGHGPGHYGNDNGYNHGGQPNGPGYGYGQPNAPGYGNGQPSTPGYGYGQPNTPGYGYGPPIPTGTGGYGPPDLCSYDASGYQCSGGPATPTGIETPTETDYLPTETTSVPGPEQTDCGVYTSTTVVTSTYILTVSVTDVGVPGSCTTDEPSETSDFPEPTNTCDYGDTDCSDSPSSTDYPTTTDSSYPTPTPSLCDGEPCPCEAYGLCSYGPSATPTLSGSEGTETPTPTPCYGNDCECEGDSCTQSSSSGTGYPVETGKPGYGIFHGGNYR